MGVFSHNVVIVTCSLMIDAKDIRDWYSNKSEIDESVRGLLSPILDNQMGNFTIVLGPDGNEEGGEISNKGDDARELLKTYLREKWSDSAVNWIEVRYGDLGPLIVDGNTENIY